MQNSKEAYVIYSVPLLATPPPQALHQGQTGEETSKEVKLSK